MKKINYDYCFTKCKDPIAYIKKRSKTHRIDWEHISKFQTLNESFIREFKDEVDWEYISRYQILSKSFIEELSIENANLRYIVRHCGKEKRLVYICKDNPSIIIIGCFRGTHKEAIKAIANNTYYKKHPIIRDVYIAKVNECFKKAKEGKNKNNH